MRLRLALPLALAGLLAILPPGQATSVEFVNCMEPEVCQAVTGHGCLIVGIAGWPPEPRINPDCVGGMPTQPPPEEPSSSPDNSTGGP